MTSINTAPFPRLLARLRALRLASLYEAARERLDPLGTSSSSAQEDPPLAPHLRGALEMIEHVGVSVSVLNLPAYPAAGGMPGTLARVLVVGPYGQRMIPAGVWDELLQGGWVTPAGRIRAQAKRVMSAEIFDEPVRVPAEAE